MAIESDLSDLPSYRRKRLRRMANSTRKATPGAEWSQHKRLTILGIGAAAGLIAATPSVIVDARGSAGELPADTVARVDDRLISRQDYERQLERLAADKRNPLTTEDRVHALDRLIEEELLILRGLEIGLTESSPPVRKAIASTMITQIVAETESLEPGRAELEVLYEESKDYFTQTGRLRVQHLRFPAGAERGKASMQAAEARDRIRRGEPVAAVKAAYLHPGVLQVPDTLLPPGKLAEYLGPTLTRAAMQLDPGAVSDPIQAGNDYHLLILVDREPAQVPAFEEILPELEVEFRRRAGDKALRDYLTWLRDRAEVVVASDGGQ